MDRSISSLRFLQKDNISNFKRDPEYTEKLKRSYCKCLYELCNIPNWEETVIRCKFTFDPLSGLELKSHTFVLEFGENIEIDEIKHSYIFKRSHFYKSFFEEKSFLKKDLETFWNEKGYHVFLDKPDEQNRWCLILCWK
jgi:hypothetical protein